MTKQEWLMWVVEMSGKAGYSDASLSARLLESAQVEGSEDVVQRAIRSPIGTLSEQQHQLVADIEAIVIRGVLSQAEKGTLFGPLDRAHEKYGQRIDDILQQGSDEFRRLAHTFVTFDTELDDFADSDRSLVLYHTLKEAEMSIRGLFFPSAGPVRVPVADRVEAMRQILAIYAPSLNTERFYSDNPVLEAESRSSGCLGRPAGVLLLIILLVLTVWV